MIVEKRHCLGVLLSILKHEDRITSHVTHFRSEIHRPFPMISAQYTTRVAPGAQKHARMVPLPCHKTQKHKSTKQQHPVPLRASFPPPSLSVAPITLLAPNVKRLPRCRFGQAPRLRLVNELILGDDSRWIAAHTLLYCSKASTETTQTAERNNQQCTLVRNRPKERGSELGRVDLRGRMGARMLKERGS